MPPTPREHHETQRKIERWHQTFNNRFRLEIAGDASACAAQMLSMIETGATRIPFTKPPNVAARQTVDAVYHGPILQPTQICATIDLGSLAILGMPDGRATEYCMRTTRN